MVDYALLAIALFLLNAQPVLNMPTWIVLSFFAMNNGDAILVMTAVGVAMATLGRYILATYTGKIADKYLPPKQKQNVKYIANFIGNKTNPIELFVISFLYGLSPLPTNTLFMVAGAAHIRLPFILAGFFFGEFFSNFVYVNAVQVTLDPGHFFLMGILGIVATAVVLLIDWKKVIYWLIEKERKRVRKSMARSEESR
jgi:hypothetical protein